MKIVLLSCCAPCSIDMIYELKSRGGEFVVLFYNPNIYPLSEYEKRLDAQKKLCTELGAELVVIDGRYNEWKKGIAGLESEPERGHRCTVCFRHRIKFAAKWATDNGYDTIATTLGVSRHKCQAQVDAAASAAIDGLKYIHINANHESPITNHDLYKQNYCGCEFSLR